MNIYIKRYRTKFNLMLLLILKSELVSENIIWLDKIVFCNYYNINCIRIMFLNFIKLIIRIESRCDSDLNPSVIPLII